MSISKTKILAITVGLTVLVGALGIVAVFVLATWGVNVFEDQVEEALEGNRRLVELVGELESLDLSITRSGQFEGDDTFVFRVDGTKEDGWLTATCITIDEETEQVTRAAIELDSGEVVELIP